MELIPHNEIACESRDRAMRMADLLMDEGYAVLLTREEALYMINYIEAGISDRNKVVFMNREVFEDKYFSTTTEDDNKDEDEDENYDPRYWGGDR